MVENQQVHSIWGHRFTRTVKSTNRDWRKKVRHDLDLMRKFSCGKGSSVKMIHERWTTSSRQPLALLRSPHGNKTHRDKIQMKSFVLQLEREWRRPTPYLMPETASERERRRKCIGSFGIITYRGRAS